MQGELVALEVPRGSGYDSQSGLNNLFPQVYGRLAADGCGKRVAFVVIHPTSNFMGHYLIGPLQRRGRAILALNTRYVGNDTALVMERAIQDLGAGVAYLCRCGYERIVLCGNSGGGSLAAFYQAEAEHITIATTPDGAPFDLRADQLPPVDGLAMLAAHPGRAATMVEWIDPSVVDERDMHATDASLDMYDPANGPPVRCRLAASLSCGPACAQRSHHRPGAGSVGGARCRSGSGADQGRTVHRLSHRRRPAFPRSHAGSQ